jgi:hypothetical protein
VLLSAVVLDVVGSIPIAHPATGAEREHPVSWQNRGNAQ